MTEPGLKRLLRQFLSRPVLPGLLGIALVGCVSTDAPPGSPIPETIPETIPEAVPEPEPVSPPLPRPVHGAALQPASDGTAGDRVLAPPEIQRTPVDQIRQTGQLGNPALDETSGLSVSRRTPGVLFALNDSGNKAQLFAMSESGDDLAQWPVDARNRDWEDMASVDIDGKPYLLLADTGDNLQRRRQSQLYLLEEPSLETPSDTALQPQQTIRFRYEDGPRNVEAMAVDDNIVYLISKEPVSGAGAQRSRLYTLPLPEPGDDQVQVARFAATLTAPDSSLESRLAAALAGIDLNHPTALDFAADGHTAYLLTYRHVVMFQRRDGQSWAEAFSMPGKRIHAHGLRQAEALTVSPQGTVWFTSEHPAAPLWALPRNAPS